MHFAHRRVWLKTSCALALGGLLDTAWAKNAGRKTAQRLDSRTENAMLRMSSGGVNILHYIPSAQWPAIASGTSTYDATADIQAAWDAEKHIYVPPGVYRINPQVGLVFGTGYKLSGAGKNQAIFHALAGGGTPAQLAAHGPGSLLRRAYQPGAMNDYVNEVQLSDLGLVMTHPVSHITTDAIQIGLDLRNVTRSVIERLHVGNVPPPAGKLSKPDPGAHAVQGFCVVVGNVSSGHGRSGGYCGGEVHSIRDCSFIGGYKLVVQDDLELSPRSAAHAVTVEGCDFQAGHHVLVQESRHATGNVWRNNTLQNVRRQPGNATPACIMRIAGYNNNAEPGYIEAGSTDYLVRFDAESVNNRVRLSHYSATQVGIAVVSDLGRRNRVDMFENTGSQASGVDAQGAPVVRYDRGYLSAWIKCHWDGSALVTDSGQSMTAKRHGTGDYTFTFALPFIDADSYSLEVTLENHSSGDAVTSAVRAHTAGDVRIQTQVRDGKSSGPADPRGIWVRVHAKGA